MRRILILLVALLLAGTILFGAWLILKQKPNTAPNPEGTTTFPTSGTPGSTIGVGKPSITITATDGTAYQVPDFTADKSKDVLPAGTYYHLTNNQETQGENAQFEIVYGTDNSITIGLIKEPLGQSRLAAEQALRSFFPLSNDQLCKLNVFVSVPGSINDTLSGKNLGLSFCPGAVQLP